jgi:Ca-activated chloride channel family protein
MRVFCGHQATKWIAWTLFVCAGMVLGACAPSTVRHNNAGNDRFDEGDYDAAIAEYRKAQVEDPDRAVPYYNAANAYNRKELLGDAAAQTQQALRNADRELAAPAWYNLGNAYYDAQEWTQAITVYQEALRINPDDLDAKHNLELSQQRLQEQQQDQPMQQSQEDQREAGDQQSNRDEQPQSDQRQPTPTHDLETAATEEQAQTTPEPPDREQDSRTMSAQQARQLLEALVGNAQTLRERLQEAFQVPAPRPARDW